MDSRATKAAHKGGGGRDGVTTAHASTRHVTLMVPLFMLSWPLETRLQMAYKHQSMRSRGHADRVSG